MSDRYDLMTGRKYKTRDGQEKTQWNRCGTMFRSKNGNGFSIVLESLPLTLDEKGGIRIQAFEPKPKDGQGGGARTGGGGFSDSDGYGDDGKSDDLPFN